MMNYFLTLFFSFVASCTFAQDSVSRSIYPFEDYRQCRTGFIDDHGDTVHKAVFEVAFWGLNGQWIVKKDTKFGLLGASGNVVVDFHFDSIYYFNDMVFAVVQEGLIGLVNRAGKQVVPCIYTEIEDGWYNNKVRYQTFIGDKMGLLDAEFNVILPAIYDNIQDRDNYDNSSADHIRFSAIWVRLNENVGLFNHLGEALIPTVNRDIQLIAVSQSCFGDHHYLVTTQNNEQVVLSSSFDTIIPFFKRIDVHFIPTIDSCDRNSALLIYGHNEDYSVAYNLESGRVSKRYRRMGYFEGYSLFRDDRGWGVLNSEFEEIYSGGKGVPSFSSAHLHGLPEDSLAYFDQFRYYSDVDRYGHSFARLFPENGLMWYDETVRDSTNWNYPNVLKYKSMGIVDLKSGRSIAPKYHRVYVHEYDGKRNFWAIDTAAKRVDVYSNKMRSKKSFDLVLITDENVEYDLDVTYARSYNGVLILKDSSGLYGAARMDGKIIIPFVHQEIHIEFNDSWTSYMERIPLRIRTYNDHYRISSIYTFDGKAIIPENQEEISSFGDGFVSKKNGIYQIYKEDWSIRYSDVTKIGWMSLLDSNGMEVKKNPEYLKSEVLTTPYFIKDSLIYQYDNGVFSVLDEKRIPFDMELRILAQSMLVSRAGKVLSSHSAIYESCQRKGSVYILLGQSHLHYFDLNGKLINRFDGLRKMNYYGHYLFVETENGRGLIDQNTGEWVFEPGVYDAVYPIIERTGFENYFWIPSASKKGSWNLIDRSGKQLCDIEFDFPQLNAYNGLLMVKSNGKFGLIAKNGVVVLPIEYEAIYQNRIFNYYTQNGLWGVFVANGSYSNPADYRFIEPRFTSVAIGNTYNDSMSIGFFVADSFTLLSKELETLVPLSKMNDLIRDTLDLQHFIDNRANSFLRKKPEPDSFTRLVKNKAFFQNQLYRSFSTLDLYKGENKSSALAGDSLFENAEYFEPENRYVSRSLLSYSSAYPFANLVSKIDTVISRSNIITNHVYTNYYLDSGELKEIEIRELFQNPYTYDAVIGDLLIDEIQRKQSFGMVCIDIPGLVLQLCEHVLIFKDGLEFSKVDGSTEIMIPWERLPALNKKFPKFPKD